MEVKNCRECGKLFNFIGGPRICPGCKKALEDKFQQVKSYVYDNKDASISQVAEENEVSVQQIRQWVREERLAFAEGSNVGLECENCGTMIYTGRFCEACKKQVANGLGNLYQKKEPEYKRPQRESARMRFLDNR